MSKQSLYVMCGLGALLLACSGKSADKGAKAKTPTAGNTAAVTESKGEEAEAPGTDRTASAEPTTTAAPEAKPSADPAAPPAPPAKVGKLRSRSKRSRAKGVAGISAGDFGSGSAGSFAEGRMGKSGGKTGRARGAYSMKKAPAGGAIAIDKVAKPIAKRDTKARRVPRRPRHRPGQLTAGEWRDLDHWGFWRALFVDSGQTRSKWKSVEKQWGYDTAGRIPVRLTADGKAVIDATVELRDAKGKLLWTARTDNRGSAELFAGLFTNKRAAGPLQIVASAAGKSVTQKVAHIDPEAKPVALTLGSRGAVSSAVDVMFVVDTTGSMGDELGYLKSELRNVIGRVKDNRGRKLSVRTSVNFYRDHGDAYLVRPFAFTSNLERVLADLSNQTANGGGDFPEAVDAALENAIYKHEWSQSARARLMFLLLDAPPHPGSKVMKSLHRATKLAAEKGIRIIPVSGSGINKPTEFLMRFLAVSTGGTYVFLTDDSGIGGSHIKPTIGPHEVKLLNQLLTEIINRYVAAQ